MRDRLVAQSPHCDKHIFLDLTSNSRTTSDFQIKMAPKLSEDEIDDLVYLARTGDDADLTELLASLAEREGATPAEILVAAKDEGKSTTLHMATGNGHVGESLQVLARNKIFFTDALQRRYASYLRILKGGQRKKSRRIWTSRMSMATQVFTGPLSVATWTP